MKGSAILFGLLVLAIASQCSLAIFFGPTPTTTTTTAGGTGSSGSGTGTSSGGLGNWLTNLLGQNSTTPGGAGGTGTSSGGLPNLGNLLKGILGSNSTTPGGAGGSLGLGNILGSIKGLFGNVTSSGGSGLGGILKKLGGLGGPLGNVIAGLTGQKKQGPIQKIFGAISGLLQKGLTIAKTLLTKLVGIPKQVIGLIQGIFHKKPTNATVTTGNTTQARALLGGGGLGGVLGNLTGTGSPLGGLGKTVGNLVGGLGGTVKGLVNGLTGGGFIGKIIAFFKGIITKVVAFFKGILAKVGSLFHGDTGNTTQARDSTSDLEDFLKDIISQLEDFLRHLETLVPAGGHKSLTDLLCCIQAASPGKSLNTVLSSCLTPITSQNLITQINNDISGLTCANGASSSTAKISMKSLATADIPQYMAFRKCVKGIESSVSTPTPTPTTGP